MAVDFALPDNDSDVEDAFQLLRDAIALAAALNPTGASNIPTGAIQAVIASGKFQRWGGASFADWQLKAAGIENAAITEAKIAAAAVTATKIGTGAVGSSAIASLAVTAAKIGEEAVTEIKIGPAAVTEAKLGSSAVTAAKVAADAVSTAKFRGVNNAWLRWRNAANDADINVIEVNSSDKTALNSISDLLLTISGVSKWLVDGTTFEFCPAANDTMDFGKAAARVKYAHIQRGIERPYHTAVAAGTTQGTATALTYRGHNVITATTATDRGVSLPAAVAGDEVIVTNIDSTDVLYVYPASGEYINGAQNTAYFVAAKTAARFECYAAGYWSKVG